MNVGLAHLLSFLALVAYAYATVGYARAVAPSGARSESPPRFSLRTVLVVGLLCHSLFVILTEFSGASFQRYPHVVSLVSFGLVGTFLLLEQRLKIGLLGVFISPIALVFLVVSAITFHSEAADQTAAQGGLLLSLHLVCTVCSYVVLFIAGGASGALLLSESALKRKKPLHPGTSLPSLVFLDRFHRGLVLTGSVFLALGLLTGTLASRFLVSDEDTMYRRLLWVSPEILAYAAVLFAIYGRGLRGRRLAWLTLGGVALVFLSLVGAMSGDGGFHGF